MDVLTQIGKQISELFTSMTPSARIMAGLMLGVIVISLGWIVGSQSTSNYETLLGGVSLSNTELDRIETAFGDAQLRNYMREGRQIRIPSNEKDQYLKALSDAKALPKESGSELDRAFQETGIFESVTKFDARYQTSREREFANNLMRMPGIEFAAVEYDEQQRGFARQSDRVCSIQLQGPFNDPIAESVMRRIAQAASTYFAGLPESNVSVLDLGTGSIWRRSDDPHSIEENPVLVAQQQWEEYYYGKVSSVLKDYGAVELMVNVELDPTLAEETEKLSYDPTAVTVQSTESRRDFENAKASPAGPPGTDINGIGNKPASIASNAAGQSSKTKESENNERRVAGHDALRKRTAGLFPKKVSVSIGIPDSYYRDVLAHRFLINNPDMTADDMPETTPAELTNLKTEIDTSVRSAVEGIAVGIREGDDRKPYVNVYAYTDLPLPKLPEPSLAENAVGWLAQSWSTLALIVIVLISMGMMFSWVKSQGDSSADKNFAEGFGLQIPDNIGDELELSSTEGDGEPGAARAKPTFDVSGEEMKEDLSALIKDNPDAVVNLLKTWIGDAA
jgi:flagellar M-ring protein FliF